MRAVNPVRQWADPGPTSSGARPAAGAERRRASGETMGVLLRSGLSALRRRFGARVSEASVRRALLGQAGIAAIESVQIGAAGGASVVSVRIHVTEGRDAREVARRVTEALCERLPVCEVRVMASEP